MTGQPADGGGLPIRPDGHRRLDRVLSPGFLAELGEQPLDELRRRRSDAEQEEADLSFLRRLLQGRLDILLAEQRRRTSAGPSSGGAAESLAGVLAGAGERRAPQGLGRHLIVEPSPVDARRRQLEQLVDDVHLSDPTRLSEDDLDAAVRRLTGDEQQVSATRHAVQAVADACAAEVGRRYRDGRAHVEDVLRPPG